MCGISAILLHPKQRSASELNEIQQIFTRNLLFNQVRGQAATGVGLVQANGDHQVLKMAVPANQLVKTSQYQQWLSTIGEETTILMGHTRNPTKGNPAQNKNNHPIEAGPVFGVHNGHINNDDLLFSKFGYKRDAEVDSEIIFRMLEQISPIKSNGSYLDEISPYLDLLDGKFTFLACDLRTPGKLIVVKHQNPLNAHYHINWQALIFSSRYIFLRREFGRAAIYEFLPSDQIMIFDAHHLPEKCTAPASKQQLEI